MGAKYFGASVPARKTRASCAGEGRFVDDIKLPGMLHAAFVRSPHAHARIAGHPHRGGRGAAPAWPACSPSPISSAG